MIQLKHTLPSEHATRLYSFVHVKSKLIDIRYLLASINVSSNKIKNICFHKMIT